MTTEPEEGVDVGHADLLALLERLEQENPEVAAAAVDREVDVLLGRAAQAPGLAGAHVVAGASSEKPGRAATYSAFAWYQSIATHLPAVLSRERTIEAAKAVEVGLFAEERIDSIDRATATRSDLRDLRCLAERGRAEFELLVLSNLRLVFHWCKGIAFSVGENWVQDAFQAGCIGLVRGLQGWDYSKGFTLSTYVSWHIRQSIQRWRLDETTVIRVPVHVWEKMESGVDDLSEETKAAALRALNVISLDDVAEDDPAQIWSGGIEEVADEIDRARTVERVLSLLTEREADVLKLRNGLSEYYNEPLTLEVIGAMYGVTRERIRQIEGKAMKKIAEDSAATSLRPAP